MTLYSCILTGYYYLCIVIKKIGCQVLIIVCESKNKRFHNKKTPKVLLCCYYCCVCERERERDRKYFYNGLKMQIEFCENIFFKQKKEFVRVEKEIEQYSTIPKQQSKRK